MVGDAVREKKADVDGLRVEDIEKPQVVSELKDYLAELKEDVNELKRTVVKNPEQDDAAGL